jgi:hypothetical protein
MIPWRASGSAVAHDGLDHDIEKGGSPAESRVSGSIPIGHPSTTGPATEGRTARLAPRHRGARPALTTRIPYPAGVPLTTPRSSVAAFTGSPRPAKIGVGTHLHLRRAGDGRWSGGKSAVRSCPMVARQSHGPAVPSISSCPPFNGAYSGLHHELDGGWTTSAPHSARIFNSVV